MTAEEGLAQIKAELLRLRTAAGYSFRLCSTCDGHKTLLQPGGVIECPDCGGVGGRLVFSDVTAARLAESRDARIGELIGQIDETKKVLDGLRGDAVTVETVCHKSPDRLTVAEARKLMAAARRIALAIKRLTTSNESVLCPNPSPPSAST